MAKAKAVLAKAKKVIAKTVAAAKKIPVIGRVVSVALSVISDAFHAAVTYAVRNVLPIARAAAGLGAIAIHLVATTYHQTAAAAAAP